MRILTLSDAHLLDLNSTDARTLLRWLAQERDCADAIVLNGDLFDFLVGRQRRALRHYAPAIDLLNECADVTKVVYIQGNHDFHLAGLFSPRIVVAESWETDCGNRRMRWEHGDLIGVGVGYRRLRAFLRSQLVRRVTEGFPPWLAWRLALLWSATSRDASPDTTEAEMLAMLPEVKERLTTTDILITGHYHFPYSHKFEHGKEWWGLGPWLKDCWYLETIDGQSTLRQAGA